MDALPSCAQEAAFVYSTVVKRKRGESIEGAQERVDRMALGPWAYADFSSLVIYVHDQDVKRGAHAVRDQYLMEFCPHVYANGR